MCGRPHQAPSLAKLESMGRKRLLMNGDKAWIITFAFVFAYDCLAAKKRWTTMSAAGLYHLEHPVERFVVTAWWSYLTAHLMGWIPRQLDPLRRWGPPDHYDDLPDWVAGRR